MRVIAGKYKRRNLIASDDLSIRPVMDRVKEYIFNVIQDWTDEGSFADIFAGSGALGIEALSRGAKQVTFVDMNPKAIKAIEKNMTHLGVTEPWRIVRQDALQFAKQSVQQFDVVFCDPPYKYEQIPEILESIEQSGLVADGGLLIVEHYSKVQLPESIGKYTLYRDKKFGKTIISMFRNESHE